MAVIFWGGMYHYGLEKQGRPKQKERKAQGGLFEEGVELSEMIAIAWEGEKDYNGD